MTKNDILMEIKRLEAQMESLEETRILTMKKAVYVLNEMKKAYEMGDEKKLQECYKKSDLLRKQADMTIKMIDETKDSCRRLFVTVYGPLGGRLYDQFIKNIEEHL